MSRDSRKINFQLSFFASLEFRWKLLVCRFLHTHTSHPTTSWRHHIKQLTNSQTTTAVDDDDALTDQITCLKKFHFIHTIAHISHIKWKYHRVNGHQEWNEITDDMSNNWWNGLLFYYIISLSHSLTYTQNFSSSFIRNVTFLLAHSVGLFLFNLFLGLFPLRIKWVDATGLMEPFFKSNFFLTKKQFREQFESMKKNQKCQFFRFKRKAVKKKKKFIHRRIFNV